jgi:hypothetical protein
MFVSVTIENVPCHYLRRIKPGYRTNNVFPHWEPTALGGASDISRILEVGNGMHTSS